MASGGKAVPFEQCMPIERFTEGQVTRADLKPGDYLTHWPELAQAQAERAPAATETIAPFAAAIDKLEATAEDQVAQVALDARVAVKQIAAEATAAITAALHRDDWDGVTDRRVDAPAAALPWDGTERRDGVERRQPEVLEAPVPGLTAEALAMDKLKTFSKNESA